MISAKDNHVFSGFSLSSSTLLLFTFWGVDFMQKSSMTSFLANLFVFLQNGTQEWSEISGVCWCFPKWSNQEIFSKSTSVQWYQFCCSLEKEKSSKSRNKSLYLKFTCHGQLFSFWYLSLSFEMFFIQKRGKRSLWINMYGFRPALPTNSPRIQASDIDASLLQLHLPSVFLWGLGCQIFNGCLGCFVRKVWHDPNVASKQTVDDYED